MNRHLLLVVAVLVFAAGESFAADRGVDFSRDIRPILNRRCTKCHGGIKQAGELSFLYRDQVVGTDAVVVPGKPDDSELIHRILSTDPDERMPPADDLPNGLSRDEIDLLTKWVEMGAPWSEHWAFLRPRNIPIPEADGDAWSRKPLDRLVLARLQAENIQPAEEADREQWLRRVSFDLIGLPPTPEQRNEFLADESDDAHQRVVHRLLQSTQFGERWAAVWLDLARYADSMGYERDPARIMWPFRDWVIRSLNNDMPFDEFTLKQVAGDLLPSPTLDDLVATAFHRNSQTNNEGGSDDEEFRIVAMVDRVNTTWTVWQGVAFGCAQCHDHPYAPFRQQEYYSFAAFFNNAADCDQGNEYPTLRIPNTPETKKRVMELDAEISEVSRAVMRPFQDLAELTDWQSLDLEEIESNKPQAKLVIREVDGREEVFASGTVALNSAYTITTSSPLDRVTAIRVDVPMLNATNAASPSPAFGVTGTDVKIKHADRSETPVSVAFTVTDNVTNQFWPPNSWGAFPNQFHARWAVLVLSEPIDLAAGEGLVVTLSQHMGRDGSKPPALRRFSLAVTDQLDWHQFVSRQKHLDQLARRSQLVKERGSIKGPNLPVMRERTTFRRQTTVFKRGNFLDKGKKVEAGFPSLLPGSRQARHGTTSQLDRRAMAQWLISPVNPLTARVMANRVWAELFGLGIVETLEDFGPTGTLPSDQRLLDHLAVQFRDVHQWSLKRLLEEIVLSATYRQDSRMTQESAARDPRNRLLARGPRNRLTAEMVRDQALATSGLLSAKMFGPSVMPPQPDGVWQTPYSGDKWVTAQGEDRYRRGLYTYWRRSMPYPSFLVFDAAQRQVCNARRITTNTPLQALVTMNDPVYVEASQALAGRMSASGGETLRDRITYGLELTTSRKAPEADVESMLRLFDRAKSQYESLPQEAAKLGKTADEAAMVLVANTILNLDNSLTK